MKSFENFVDENIYFRQHGEGLCYPALLNIYLKMIGHRGWTTEKIAKVLGVTTSNGIEHDHNLFCFLKELRVPYHEEIEVSSQRLTNILTRLPEKVMAIGNIWDMSIRNGYDLATDPPEEHGLWLQKTIKNNGQYLIKVFNPDTLIGGPRLLRLEDFFAIWHDGNGTSSGVTRKNGSYFDQKTLRWLLLLGIGDTEVEKRFGKPPNEVFGPKNPRITVTESGLLLPENGKRIILSPTDWSTRLWVDPGGFEPPTYCV